MLFKNTLNSCFESWWFSCQLYSKVAILNVCARSKSGLSHSPPLLTILEPLDATIFRATFVFHANLINSSHWDPLKRLRRKRRGSVCAEIIKVYNVCYFAGPWLGIQDKTATLGCTQLATIYVSRCYKSVTCQSM